MARIAAGAPHGSHFPGARADSGREKCGPCADEDRHGLSRRGRNCPVSATTPPARPSSGSQRRPAEGLMSRTRLGSLPGSSPGKTPALRELAYRGVLSTDYPLEQSVAFGREEVRARHAGHAAYLTCGFASRQWSRGCVLLFR